MALNGEKRQKKKKKKRGSARRGGALTRTSHRINKRTARVTRRACLRGAYRAVWHRSAAEWRLTRASPHSRICGALWLPAKKGDTAAVEESGRR